MRTSSELNFGACSRNGTESSKKALRFVSAKSNLCDKAKSQLVTCESFSLQSYKLNLNDSEALFDAWQTNLDHWKQKRQAATTTTSTPPHRTVSPLRFEFELNQLEQCQQESKTCCETSAHNEEGSDENAFENSDIGQTSFLSVPLPVINSNLSSLKSSVGVKSTNYTSNNKQEILFSKESSPYILNSSTVDQLPKRKLSGEQVMQKAALFEKLATTSTPLSVDKSFNKIPSRLQFITVDSPPPTTVTSPNPAKLYSTERKVSFFSNRLIDDVVDSGVETNRESSPSRDSREGSSPRSNSSSESGDNIPIPARRKVKVCSPPAPLEINDHFLDSKWKYQRKDVQKSYEELKVCIQLNAENRERGFGFTLKGGKEKREPLTIETVIKGSGADKVGMQIGDVLLEVDGEDVADQYLTKVNPSIREAMKLGEIELRLKRFCHVFSNGTNGPASPKESELSPGSQVPFSERRSVFEKENQEKPEHPPRAAKNRRHSTHTNANSVSIATEKKRNRHRSVDAETDRYPKIEPKVEPAKSFGQTKPCYTTPVPVVRSSSFNRKNTENSSEIVENGRESKSTLMRDYRVTSLHEERSVGKILDFVPESERYRRSSPEFSSKNATIHGPQPFVPKVNEPEDYQWRRERERVMARAGPAGSTLQARSGPTDSVLQVRPGPAESVLQKKSGQAESVFQTRSGPAEPVLQRRSGPADSILQVEQARPQKFNVGNHCNDDAMNMRHKVSTGFPPSMNNFGSASPVSVKKCQPVKNTVCIVNGDVGANGTSHLYNSKTVTTITPAVYGSLSPQLRKSPQEAVKLIDKWLSPKLMSPNPENTFQFDYNRSPSPTITSQNDANAVRKHDHEMGVTSVKRYTTPKVDHQQARSVACTSPMDYKSEAPIRKTSIPKSSCHSSPVTKSFTVNDNNVRRINYSSTRRLRTRLKEARDNFYGLKKSTSLQFNLNSQTTTNDVADECRCECDAKVLSRREKLKKFTYQITVQDPRKSIARPLAVRQERSILIVQVRADDNNEQFESTSQQLQSHHNAPIYRVERSQSSGVVMSNIKPILNDIKPERQTAGNLKYEQADFQGNKFLTKQTSPATVSNGHCLQKSSSDYGMTKMSNGSKMNRVMNRKVSKDESPMDTTMMFENVKLNKRKMSLEEQIEAVTTLANRALGEPVNPIDSMGKHRPPSPKFPTNNQEQAIAVSDRQLCSHCSKELGKGAAMTIESLRMFFHVPCFKCFVCDMPLGDGSHGADVRVRARKLHCQKCYSSVENGLRCSAV